jgi:hypothetical protein
VLVLDHMGCAMSCLLDSKSSRNLLFGTPIQTEHGDKPIDRLVSGDLVLSTSVTNPEAPPSIRVVQQVVTSRQESLNLVVSGRTIQTTMDHPIYVRKRGWLSASSLVIGDQLHCHGEQHAEVESIGSGEEVVVYNLVIDGESTYFVGSQDWQFSICVADSCVKLVKHNEILPRLFIVASSEEASVSKSRNVPVGFRKIFERSTASTRHAIQQFFTK